MSFEVGMMILWEDGSLFCCVRECCLWFIDDISGFVGDFVKFYKG